MFAVLPEKEITIEVLDKCDDKPAQSCEQSSSKASSTFFDFLGDASDDGNAMFEFEELMGLTTSLKSQKSVDSTDDSLEVGGLSIPALADESTASQSSA